MGRDSKIEWTDHTFNPWRGCCKVSPGCGNCYAELQARRNPAVLGEWGPNSARIVAAKSMWNQPLSWCREAESEGVRRRVFCGSMCDVFEDRPDLVEPRARLIDLIRETERGLDWLLLTNRPENIVGLWAVPMPPNVWLGTSVENQAAADERIPHLLRCPATVRFLSCEPLLEAVDLSIDGDCSDWACRECGSRNVDTEVTVGPDDVSTYKCLNCDYFGTGEDAEWRSLIDWVIVGGESGPKSRPCRLGWIRSVVQQCQAADVPVFVKQLGAFPCLGSAKYERELSGDWLKTTVLCGDKQGEPYAVALRNRKGNNPAEWPEDLRVREFPHFSREK